MVTVYRARDLRHGREVAVKVMDPAISAEIGHRHIEPGNNGDPGDSGGRGESGDTGGGDAECEPGGLRLC